MLQSLKDILPATPGAVTDWIFLLMLGYLAADLILSALIYAMLKRFRYSLVSSISNSILFSTSILLLGGALNGATLAALGSLTIYLLFAGFVGVGFATQEMFRKFGP